MRSHTRIPTYYVLFYKYTHLQINRKVGIPRVYLRVRPTTSLSKLLFLSKWLLNFKLIFYVIIKNDVTFN